MPKRDVAIEILSPTQGIHKELGESLIQIRSTPNALGANAYYGMVQKEYGTTRICGAIYINETVN